jgi:hypothetical protein
VNLSTRDCKCSMIYDLYSEKRMIEKRQVRLANWVKLCVMLSSIFYDVISQHVGAHVAHMS